MPNDEEFSKRTCSLLQRARTLIADPSNWSQGVTAQTKAGEVTSISDPRATCFCAVGALARAFDEITVLDDVVFQRALERLDGLAKLPLAIFNDTNGRTHAEVLALYDRAIAAVGA